jgi:hypothetical protein
MPIYYKSKNVRFFTKSYNKIWEINLPVLPLHSFQGNTKRKVLKNGSIAQLVQSICLTSRGSAVRIRVLPHFKKHPFRMLFLFQPILAYFN